MFSGGNRGHQMAHWCSSEGECEILNGKPTGSGLHFKIPSSCCVEIILQWSKDGNKDTTWEVITVLTARDNGGLGHCTIGMGELYTNNWLQSAEAV